VRFVIEAGATVKVLKSGQILHAKTVNMSGGGVLLHSEESVSLAVGDPVDCEFRVFHEPGSPLPWGMGDVIRLEGCSVAIMLKAGGFCPLNSELDSSESLRF
jgi:PilZ domain